MTSDSEGRCESVANEKNLKTPTAEEARERGKKGGQASAKKRKERKQMQEIAKIVLDMPVEPGEVTDLEGITFEDYPDVNLTIGELSVLAIAKKAKKGDVAALTFLRDTAGEKPAEKVEVSGDVAAATEDIKEMIAAAKKKGNG